MSQVCIHVLYGTHFFFSVDVNKSGVPDAWKYFIFAEKSSWLEREQGPFLFCLFKTCAVNINKLIFVYGSTTFFFFGVP